MRSATHALPKTRSCKIMRRLLRKIAEGANDVFGGTSTLADPSVVEALLAGRAVKHPPHESVGRGTTEGGGGVLPRPKNPSVSASRGHLPGNCRGGCLRLASPARPAIPLAKRG